MKKFIIIVVVICLFIGGMIYCYINPDIYYFFIPTYTNEDFGIQDYLSYTDKNNNGIDDVVDVLNGAKEEAKRHPIYHSEYYAGGYPPASEGVCTDVIWRSFQNAGIDIKSLIDEDIANHSELYTRVDTPDPNIDFRRVPNLDVFFSRYAISLSTDPYDIEEWQAGDIVIFSNKHIGIVSDLRNKKGVSYIIHNAGQIHFEEDALVSYDKHTPIKSHYRFIF